MAGPEFDMPAGNGYPDRHGDLKMREPI